MEGRADWAQGLPDGEEFSLYWESPAYWDHLPEASAGIGSSGHSNNRNARKEFVVYR